MRSRTVLIIDDSNFSREVSKSFFQLTNYSVITAANAVDAIELIKKEPPDLIFTDLHMPVMSGEDLCRCVKTNPFLRAIPIIVLTSSNNEDDNKKCLDAGCATIIKKPLIDLKAFFKTISEYLPDITYREYPRVPLDVAALCRVNGNEYSVRTRNISEGGILISGDMEFSYGDMAEVQFTLPSAVKQILVKGKVVRITKEAPPCSGIQFVYVNIEGRKAISEYIKSTSRTDKR